MKVQTIPLKSFLAYGRKTGYKPKFRRYHISSTWNKLQYIIQYDELPLVQARIARSTWERIKIQAENTLPCCECGVTDLPHDPECSWWKQKERSPLCKSTH